MGIKVPALTLFYPSTLSGISLNRMMTMHKYAPWICLYMSGVHTWSMIIKANRQQPWWYTWATDEFYRNGFIPLAALAWLCFMSLSPFRSGQHGHVFERQESLLECVCVSGLGSTNYSTCSTSLRRLVNTIHVNISLDTLESPDTLLCYPPSFPGQYVHSPGKSFGNLAIL